MAESIISQGVQAPPPFSSLNWITVYDSGNTLSIEPRIPLPSASIASFKLPDDFNSDSILLWKIIEDNSTLIFSGDFETILTTTFYIGAEWYYKFSQDVSGTVMLSSSGAIPLSVIIQYVDASFLI